MYIQFIPKKSNDRKGKENRWYIWKKTNNMTDLNLTILIITLNVSFLKTVINTQRFPEPGMFTGIKAGIIS